MYLEEMGSFTNLGGEKAGYIKPFSSKSWTKNRNKSQNKTKF